MMPKERKELVDDTYILNVAKIEVYFEYSYYKTLAFIVRKKESTYSYIMVKENCTIVLDEKMQRTHLTNK